MPPKKTPTKRAAKNIVVDDSDDNTIVSSPSTPSSSTSSSLTSPLTPSLTSSSTPSSTTSANSPIEITDITTDIVKLLDDPYTYAKNMPLNRLVTLLKKFSQEYYHSTKPLITDVVFDLLKDVLEERDPSNEFLTTIGAPLPTKEAVPLPYPMASLNKIKPDTNLLEDWKKKHKGPYVISDKLDGISGLLHKAGTKFKLYTRGDITSGQDISHLVKYILSDKYDLSKIPDGTAIRGEIIMNKKNFETVKDKYANARNTVAGLVNSKHYSVDIAKLTDFVAYSVLNPKYKQEEQMSKLELWKFPTVTYKVLNDITNDSLSKYFQERRTSSLYEVDGIVVIDSSKIYDLADKNPTYGFAFKMVLTDQVAEVIVKDVEWNISKHGYLKPRLVVEPTKLVGVTITYATAFNAKYVVDNVLGPGAIVKIVRSGDVIPHILKVIKPAASGKPKMPLIPYIWNKSNIDIVVKDMKDTEYGKTIAIKRITSFFQKLSIKFISEGIVTKLVDAGYNSIAKILNANKDDLAKIDGIGEKIVAKIFDNAAKAFKTTNLETVMGASNIFGRGLGVKKNKIIVNTYPNIMNEIWDKKTMKEKILGLNGFDDITASQFVEHFDEFKKFYAELETIQSIDIKHLKIAKVKVIKGKLFENQKVVFTGFRDKDWEEFIVSNGGQVTGTVTKNTTLLVHADDDTTSSKYVKAVELEITVISRSEFAKKYAKDLAK